MDTRIALKNNTKLRFYNSSNGICVYTIQKELARGASCIVYEASYVNNAGTNNFVRIKECYPFSLMIQRDEDNCLHAQANEQKEFEEYKSRMFRDFELGNELMNTKGLTNYTTNSVDIYELNNTVYIVTVYQEGEILSYHQDTTLKDCIRIVKSIARVIEKIHNKGYLYLDIKPENIFVWSETTELVQVFDFDSLIPMSAFTQPTEEFTYKISYTKGFSALELQMGDLKNINKHTDVYAIGTILFYLIFKAVPKAMDCDIDAVYDYEQSKYASKTFQDKLYYELTDFFHHTIANFYLDRYQDMQQVIHKLEKIEALADTTVPYMLPSYSMYAKTLIGRAVELNQLKEWMEDKEQRLIYITGMGGIGKTTIVQRFITEHMQEFTTIITLNYHHSLKQTITDDKQFMINTLMQSDQENLDEYFIRKLMIAKKLTHQNKTLLVIDNVNGEDVCGLDELLKLDWKVIMITRKLLCHQNYACLQVEAIKDKKDLYMIFENNLRRVMEHDEYEILDRIIDKVQGHTLVLELIAKQIVNSFLTLKEAEILINEHGFSKMAMEKVAYTKDDHAHSDTIQNIINTMFQSIQISEQKRSVLKSIAYFGTAGIEVNLFASIYGLMTKDVINELVAEGWLTIDNYKIMMHPVIIETIRNWDHTNAFRKIALHILSELKKMLSIDTKGILSYCEEFLQYCKQDHILMNHNVYKELLFEVLCIMPRHKEDYILDNAIQLTQNLGDFSGDVVIRLYEMITEIYEEQGKLEKAYACIVSAKKTIFKFADDHLKGQYYYLLVGYYDCKLNGYYDTRNKEEAKILSLLMKSLHAAIRYMKKSYHQDGKKLLAEYYRCKANIFIRSRPNTKFRIRRLLHKVDELIKTEGQEYTKLNYSYLMTCAWYYTYVEVNNDMVINYIQQAYEVESMIRENDLDFIDNLLVPSANILLESALDDEAEMSLLQGIQICEEHQDMLPYRRKKKELYMYLLDVYQLTNNETKYEKIVDIMQHDENSI